VNTYSQAPHTHHAAVGHVPHVPHVTTGVTVQVKVHQYITSTIHQPHQPHQKFAALLDQFTQAAVIEVDQLFTVKFHHTSMIRHQPPAHHTQASLPPAHQDHGDISINLLHITVLVSVYVHQCTHHVPDHHIAVPLFIQEAHHGHDHHTVIHHVFAGANITLVDVQLVQIAPHGHHLPAKLKVRFVKSAFHFIFICTTHHVGVTVHILAAVHAAQLE